MVALTRDTLTADLLAEEAEEAQSWIDDSHAAGVARARARAMIALLGSLPEGFRIERVQGKREPGRDPGAELTLIDARFRPARVVGKVARRLIGEQRITWTGRSGPSVDPESAEAFAVMLRLAVMDAEGRSRR
jgi:hypothetical protein